MRKIFGLHDDRITNEEKEHRLLARQAACEGIVLLKNNGVLPLKNQRIALFGVGARHTIKGGTGSGEVFERYSISIAEGLLAHGYHIENSAWLDEYDQELNKSKIEWQNLIEEKMKKEEPQIDACHLFSMINWNLFKFPKPIMIADHHLDDSPVAFYIISRQAGEGNDRALIKGDWYLDDVEIQNIQKIAQHYKDTIIVINCGGMIDLSPLDGIHGISAIIHFSQGGEEGGNAFNDVVSGKVSPSGKLVDTWALKYEDYPGSSTFGNLDGNPFEDQYREGIMVGYRYFDAFDIKTRYPFGYGLSYTSFQIDYLKVSQEGHHRLKLFFKVTNTGHEYSGKEIVQLYLKKPQGKLRQEKFVLVGYFKTKCLAPQEQEEFHLLFDLSKWGSYDEDNSVWILESGTYGLFVGTNSHEIRPILKMEVQEETILSRCQAICPLKKPFEELRPAIQEYNYPDDVSSVTLVFEDYNIPNIVYQDPEIRCENDEVKHFLASLSTDELIKVCVGTPYYLEGHFLTPGIAGKTNIDLMTKGIPNINLADGPSGLFMKPRSFYDEKDNNYLHKSFKECQDLPFLQKEEFQYLFLDESLGRYAYNYMTAFPVPIMQAQSWNQELVKQIGNAIGKEMLQSGISIWLAPGMNIHRNPLCGRTFEYYSEDPYLSGTMAAALTNGVQSNKGVSTCLKHFCCNHQEEERVYTSANVHERALREIYLRNFQIALELSSPGAIMSSYNKVNGVYTPNSHDLLTKVLRNEWHFKGLVMTDWASTDFDRGDHTYCLPSGNDLIMPGNKEAIEAIKNGLAQGIISLKDLQRCAANVLNTITRSALYQEYKREKLAK